MFDPKAHALGRIMCHAVAKATGLPSVRDAQVSANIGDVTTITVEFIPTDEMMAAIGKALADLAASNPAVAAVLAEGPGAA